LEAFTRNADVLISAVGQPNLILPQMLKKGVVVIDVGINTWNGRLVGDVFHPERLSELEKVVSIITAVPGGIGPITVAALLENTFEIYNKRLSI
jgi:methylenetetrahydrofolate dehydrogenase (NADP+)/methenyltetrahydrofolate cyclohydrolase